MAITIRNLDAPLGAQVDRVDPSARRTRRVVNTGHGRVQRTAANDVWI